MGLIAALSSLTNCKLVLIFQVSFKGKKNIVISSDFKYPDVKMLITNNVWSQNGEWRNM